MRVDSRFLADVLVCLRFCSRLPLPDPDHAHDFGSDRVEHVTDSEGFERDAGQPPDSTFPRPARGPDAEPHGFTTFPRAARMLPVAGAALGGLAALVLTISSAARLPPELASALAIGALVLLTGALHEDGLADCADGLGGGATRERKLEIMRDSRVGTYGAIAIALTLYLRIASLAEIVTHSLAQAALASIAAGAISRAAALVPLHLLAPARADGSGHSAGRPEARAMAIAALLASVSACAPVFAGADPKAALLALVGAGTIAIGATGLAYRQIGGQTGDVAGAVQQLAEVSVLLAFSAR